MRGELLKKDEPVDAAKFQEKVLAKYDEADHFSIHLTRDLHVIFRRVLSVH